MLDKKTITRLQERFYPAAEQPLREFLTRYLRPEVRLLDAGCGEGTWVLRYFGLHVGYVVGTDTNKPEGKGMDSFLLANLDNLPIADGTFDAILCFDVIEHLQYPEKAFAEFFRVLRDKGTLVIITPNLASPPFLVSHLMPFRWHQAVKRAIAGTAESEVFPTYYRCNTAKRLKRTLSSVGFRAEYQESVEIFYGYLAFDKIAYVAGLLASRLIQRMPWARPFRGQLLGSFRKVVSQ
jgi:SAM-dependent methyltransferase